MADSTIESFIAQSGFFSGLSSEHALFLAENAKRIRLEAGDVLFRHGDDARQFYLVAAGRVSVQIAAIEGPALELQDLGPHAVLGWSWLIAPYKWSFQARATTSADIVAFDGAAILARCENDPAFGYQLLKRFSALMSERLQFARQKMIEEWKPAGFA